MAQPQRPRPTPTPMTEPFWEGLKAGKLLVQRCLDCDRWRWTPQLACPGCWSERYEWAQASGRGTLYTYTIVHRSVDPETFPAPYVLAVVQLEEGPHMLTNIVDCPTDQLRMEMPVQVRFERVDDDFCVYPFAPVES